ncbi:MAG: tetratricopeptide repeat protein, partial [Byssovorax sp.]
VSLMVVWFFICIALTVSKQQAVANVAHGVGALLGLLVGVILVEKRAALRALAGLGLASVIAGAAAGATRLRPVVSLSKTAGPRIAREAYLAITENRYQEAIAGYQDAVVMSPGEAGYWFNLGIAYERSGQPERSHEAFKKAFELEPKNPKFREAASPETP